MLDVEVSLFPQKTNDASGIIHHAIDSLAQQGVQYQVGSLSTHLSGSDEQVWAGIKKMFEEAKNSGAEVNMVLTMTNAGR